MPGLGNLENYLKKTKRLNANKEVREWCIAAREYLTIRLNAHATSSVDNWRNKLQRQGIEPWLRQTKLKADDMIRSNHDSFIKAMQSVLNQAIDNLEPPPPSAPSLSYDGLLKDGKIVLQDKAEKAVGKLPGTAFSNYKTKVCGIYARGSSYGGHGPTSALGAGVIHCHIGNGDGVGFKWSGEDTLEIWGHGIKDDSATKGQGNSGYKWN